MENDGKLYIIISDKREGTGTESTQSATGSNQSDSVSKRTAGSLITHQFNNFVIGQAKQFVNYTAGNVGNFIGDYITQRKVNENMQGINVVMSIGGSFVAGTMMSGGNPLVGAAFAAIATAGMAINTYFADRTQVIQNNKQNYSIDQLRRRAGLNVYLDDSRGTEN